MLSAKFLENPLLNYLNSILDLVTFLGDIIGSTVLFFPLAIYSFAVFLLIATAGSGVGVELYIITIFAGSEVSEISSVYRTSFWI